VKSTRPAIPCGLRMCSGQGTVAARPPETVNPDLPTGEIEIDVASVEILNRSETPPFGVEEQGDVDREPAPEVPLHRSAAR